MAQPWQGREILGSSTLWQRGEAEKGGCHPRGEKVGGHLPEVERVVVTRLLLAAPVADHVIFIVANAVHCGKKEQPPPCSAEAPSHPSGAENGSSCKEGSLAGLQRSQPAPFSPFFDFYYQFSEKTGRLSSARWAFLQKVQIPHLREKVKKVTIRLGC